jgi:hypothetical protein
MSFFDSDFDHYFDQPSPANEVTWARGRLPDRTYAYKTFPFHLRTSRDYGQPARYICKVFDEAAEPEDLASLRDIDRT